MRYSVGRLTGLLLGFFLLLTGLVHPALAQGTNSLKLTDDQQQVYNKLRDQSSNFFINWDKQNFIPNWVRMTNLEMDWRSADYTERAYQFLEEYGALYNIIDPKQVFSTQGQKQDTLGMTHVTLQQIDHGVSVFAGQLQFNFRSDGTLSSIGGRIIPGTNNISSKPTITQQRARWLAKQAVRQQLDITQDQLNTLELQSTEPTLYFYNHGVFSKRDEDTYLVWTFSVHSRKALLDQVFYINAHTGSIVNTINNIQTFKDINTLVLADCTDAIGTLTYNEASTSDTDTIGSASSDAQAWEVNGYTGLVYDYHFDTFGRDSFDDTDPTDSADGGGTINSHTHYEVDNSGTCTELENAFWEPTDRIMRYGEDFISLDVAGHELTHAVVQYSVGTTDDDTLTYEYETGALNESYADIFGELIEFANGGGDWLLGTDLPNGPSRDFANPNMGAYDRTMPYDGSTNYGQPSHVSEQSQVTDPLCGSYTNDDNGCIHLNSGITNNAFYLLVNGGTNPYSGDAVTTGIGIDAAQQIYYRALTTYLDIASDFDDAYQATLQSCLDLNASNSTTYPISYCEAVFDAFAAVGINTDISYAWANITASATSGTAPLAITFDAADSVGINSTIDTYVWDFGDGSTDSGGAVSYTYTNPGTYTVTLTVIDSGGYVADTSTIITVYASSYITTDTTWSSAYSPYVIDGSIAVNSGYILTIEPGTVIKFYDATSSLTVNGTLDAEGTATDSIVFTSYKDDDNGGDTNGDGTATTPAAGDWYYFKVAGSAIANLDYVTMQYGGYTGTSSDYAMFLIDDNATNVSVDNSTLQYSQYHTLQIDTGSTSTIQNSTITNSASQPATYITGGTSTLTGNTISSNSSHGVSMSSASPTLTNNTFTGNTYGVYVYGYTSAPTITNNTFTGNTYGVYISRSASAPAITDNIFTENTYGLYVTGSSSTSSPTINDNTFTGNSYPMLLGTLTSGTTLTGNTGSGNTYNIILLSGSTAGNFTLNMENDLPYVFGSLTVSSGNTLTIDPGMVMKFFSTNSLIISGTLFAVGTSSDPIILTSYKDDTYGGDTNGDGSATSPAAGDWGYIKTSSGATATLDYVTIQYGGFDPMFLIDDNTANVSIDHSTLQYSSSNTLEIDSGSTSTISNSIITNNAISRAIKIMGGTTTLTGNTISATSYGVDIWNTSPTLVSNTFTGTTNGVTIYGATSAPTFTTNTFISNAFGLYVDGGTPILDSNTFSGNSYGVYIESGANPEVTNNLIYTNTYGLLVSGSSVSQMITNNTITGNTYGLYVYNGASPSITNNQIYDNTSYGLYNTDPSMTVTAESNWWGDTSGPYNATSNPSGTGDWVSDYVDFDPWLTADPDADITPPSDPILGTTRKDVWAQTITLNWTNPTDSDFDHVQVDRTDVAAGTTTTLSSSETGTSYIDSTPSYNITYTYTVYAVDTAGNSSTGVTSANQRLRNPTPTNLTLTAGDTTITATWTASSAPTTTLGGYIVYYGTSRTALTNSIDVGNTTNTTLTGLTNYTRYYVAVSAYNKGGDESALSQIRATRPHP